MKRKEILLSMLLTVFLFAGFGTVERALGQVVDDIYYDPSEEIVDDKNNQVQEDTRIENYTPQSKKVDNQSQSQNERVYTDDQYRQETQDVYGQHDQVTTDDQLAGDDFSFQDHFGRLNGEDVSREDVYDEGFDDGYDEGLQDGRRRNRNYSFLFIFLAI